MQKHKFSYILKVINLLHLSVANPVEPFVICSAKCKIINTFNIETIKHILQKTMSKIGIHFLKNIIKTQIILNEEEFL